MTELFEMRGLTKSYEAVKALDWGGGDALSLSAGTVLGLAGENGAGKSTILGALTGSVTLDAGELTLAGRPYHPTGPFDALARGVALIPQETLLAPTLTVAENVLLGREAEYTKLGVVVRRRRDALAREALDIVGLDGDLDMRRPVSALALEHRKLIELARALAAGPRVLLVDETSNVLSRDGAIRLFELIHRFAAAGGATIFVTHRLDEIVEHCTDVAVLKDGRLVDRKPVAETSETEIAHAMVGRDLDADYDEAPRPARPDSPVLLRARGLVAAGCEPFDLDLRAGEIVGMGGLVGCGADDLARALAGAVRATAGTVEINGRDVSRSGLRGRVAAGAAYLPKDRDDEGLLLGSSILQNVVLGSLDRHSRAGFLWPRAGSQGVRDQIARLSIKAGGPQALVQELSGGNRQKVLLARWLHRDVPVLILNNPTRGVDVGAKGDIYRLIDQARELGKAIVLVSDELPELRRLADRILILRRGVVTTRAERPLPSEHDLIGAML